MKKIFGLLGIIMTLCMVMTVFSFADAGLDNFNANKSTYKAGQFKDVSKSEWYYDSVKQAYELNLVKGMSEAEFNPNGNITIAETLALACRLNSIYKGEGGAFMQGEPWYQVYVDYAIGNGIIRSGQYRDFSAKATRTQFAIIMSNALPAEALPAINSVKTIPDVKYNAVGGHAIYKLYNAGILTGNDANGTFYPNSNIKRSEVSAIVTRMAVSNLRKHVEFQTEKAYAADFLGKTIGEVKSQYGTGAPYSYSRYLDGSVACLFYDEYKMLFVPESYANCFASNPPDSTKVLSVVAFGFTEVSPGLCANMTLSEITAAIGYNPGSVYDPDEGGETGENYFSEFRHNGNHYLYGWENNVNEQASSVWVTK